MFNNLYIVDMVDYDGNFIVYIYISVYQLYKKYNVFDTILFYIYTVPIILICYLFPGLQVFRSLSLCAVQIQWSGVLLIYFITNLFH